MKSLTESILDDEDDVMNDADNKVAKYAKEHGWITSIIGFTKNYFENLYKGHEFEFIDDILQRTGRTRRGGFHRAKEYKRYVLVCDGTDANQYVSDYRHFVSKLKAHAKSLDKELYSKLTIDDKSLDDVTIYIDDVLGKSTYTVVTCTYIYHGESYFVGVRAQEGGAKIAIRYPIDK